LVGFSREHVQVCGHVEIQMTLKEGDLAKTNMIKYVFVNAPLPYNILLE